MPREWFLRNRNTGSGTTTVLLAIVQRWCKQHVAIRRASFACRVSHQTRCIHLPIEIWYGAERGKRAYWIGWYCFVEEFFGWDNEWDGGGWTGSEIDQFSEFSQIITKAGRRMFPVIRIRLQNLQPRVMYNVCLAFVQQGTTKWQYNEGGWLTAGKAEVQPENCYYVHPDSPNFGDHWCRETISFAKMKISNKNSDKQMVRESSKIPFPFPQFPKDPSQFHAPLHTGYPSLPCRSEHQRRAT